jgi:hypothetical protein
MEWNTDLTWNKATLNSVVGKRRSTRVELHGGTGMGSTMFFWRWPLDYTKEATLGAEPRFNGDPPSYFDPQPPYTNEGERARMTERKSSRSWQTGTWQNVDPIPCGPS